MVTLTVIGALWPTTLASYEPSLRAADAVVATAEMTAAAIKVRNCMFSPNNMIAQRPSGGAADIRSFAPVRLWRQAENKVCSTFGF